jgi:hypothetical protein
VTACTISHASKCLPLKSSFDCRFSFSAIAFRIIRTLHNIWSGNFSSDGQHTLSAKICDRPAKRHGQSPAPEIGGDDKEYHGKIWSCRQIPHFDRCPVNVTVPSVLLSGCRGLALLSGQALQSGLECSPIGDEVVEVPRGLSSYQLSNQRLRRLQQKDAAITTVLLLGHPHSDHPGGSHRPCDPLGSGVVVVAEGVVVIGNRPVSIAAIKEQQRPVGAALIAITTLGVSHWNQHEVG